MHKLLISAAAIASMLVAAPAVGASAEGPTVVTHNDTHTASYPDGTDICGRPQAAHTDIWTVKTSQVHLNRATDGTGNYHDVAVVTYVSDYVDPTIPDLHGRLTEVNRFTLTPGQVYTSTTSFHDFFGDVRIWVKFHTTDVKGEVVVNREFVKVECDGSILPL